jgi:predicted MPP superfamily phosphohydrolase
MLRFPKIRASVGRGSGFSRLRGFNETVLKPIWEHFPTERLAHRLTPPTQITEVTFKVPDYFGRRLRIAFLSDLHAGPTTSTKIFDEAFEHVAAAKPDAVLLGGDYIYFDADNVQQIARHVEKMVSRFPTWGVWGNHDLWADDRYLDQFFQGLGVRMLCNEWVFDWLGEPIDLYGVDDPWTGVPDFSPLIRRERPLILLCHNPDGLLLMDPSHRADIMLCGHTHGGQICRKDGRPYFVHARTGTRFAGGRYSHEGKEIYVSKGIGAVEAPLRMYAPPEVVIVNLEPGR